MVAAAALDDAYRACAAVASAHDENFPVASWLIPRPMRRHIAAIYAFARTADDIADEGYADADTRLRALDAWERRLDEPPTDPVFIAVAHTIAACALDVQLLRDLVSAFRQDVTQHSYATWEQLLDYCRRSANPVGRLVLGIAGVTRADALGASDALCTALQLTNFWQDVAIDRVKGRDYLPQDLVAAAGADAPRDAIRRTRALFAAGRPITGLVDGRLRWELRATWLGGARILELVDAQMDAGRFGAARPRLTRADLALVGWRMLRWRDR